MWARWGHWAASGVLLLIHCLQRDPSQPSTLRGTVAPLNATGILSCNALRPWQKLKGFALPGWLLLFHNREAWCSLNIFLLFATHSASSVRSPCPQVGLRTAKCDCQKAEGLMVLWFKRGWQFTKSQEKQKGMELTPDLCAAPGTPLPLLSLGSKGLSLPPHLMWKEEDLFHGQLALHP